MSDDLGRSSPNDMALRQWIEKTNWVQDEFDKGRYPGGAGRHRADVMRSEIFRLRAILEQIRTYAEQASFGGWRHDIAELADRGLS